jgi:15-cis-phytoene desaturase
VHSQLISRRDWCFGFPTVGLSALYTRQCVRIIEEAGGQVRTGTKVRATRHAPGAHVVMTEEGEYVGANLVYAVPPSGLRSLQPRIADTSAFVPSPYKSVYLWLDRKLTDERFWALLWKPTRLNYDFYELANIRPGIHGAKSLIASNIIWSHRADGLSDDDIVRATVAELMEFEPRARVARVLHADVHHIPMAIPCPLVGTESLRPETRTEIPGVYLAGDWVSTHLPCSMESAVKSGLMAAAAVPAPHGQRTDIVLPPRPDDFSLSETRQ